MSAQELQHALLKLVRFPESFRGEESHSFINEFDLSQKEQWQLHSLIHSFYVAKFGKDRRWKRFRTYVKHFYPCTVKTIGLEKAQDIFYNHFEPAHPSLGLADVSTRFYFYFLDNIDLLRRTVSVPDFATDILRCEFAEHALIWNYKDQDWVVPVNSLISSKVSLRILEFNYDVANIIEPLKAEKLDTVLNIFPEKRLNTVLFVKIPSDGNEGSYKISQFEIDKDLSQFLIRQIKGTFDEEAKFPSCYLDLVEMGICKPTLLVR